MIAVEEQIARWVCTIWTGAGWSATEANVTVFEGKDPFAGSVCAGGSPDRTPTIVTSCIGAECLEAGDVGTGFYDPASNEYKIIATRSAMLGTPDDINAVDGISNAAEGCGLDTTVQPFKGFKCEQPQAPGPSVEFPISYQRVATGNGATSDGNICTTFIDIPVLCAAPSVEVQTCIDICDLVCNCDEFYSVAECEPEDCNCGDCLIEDILQLTVQFRPTGSANYTINKSGPAVNTGSDGCCWDVPMDDGSTFEACYLPGGMQWQVTGTSTAGDSFSGRK